MTQEEQDLLLKVLCAMLPYGVMCKWYGDGVTGIGKLDSICKMKTGDDFEYWDCYFEDNGDDIPIEIVKPYLRPLSSMTKEEKRELQNILSNNKHGVYLKHDEEWEIIVDSYYPYIPLEGFTNGFNWLNKKKFDYHSLIPMGLALPAPEGMYN